MAAPAEVKSDRDRMFKRASGYFYPGVGAGQFFTSIIFWGTAAGCFTAVLNNYLADVRQMGAFDRGLLEFFRELPGLMLVFIILFMHRISDWKILKIGTLVAAVGVAGLVTASDKALIILLIAVWSTGEHILMPVRSSVAMRIAREGMAGRSLGLVTGTMNLGTVLGSAAAALVFFAGSGWLGIRDQLLLYDFTWGMIIFLLLASVIAIICFKDDSRAQVRRPRLYFRRKYTKFYALELFYGARKQIFLTFAPYVLILHYGMETSFMALLMGVCALVNIFCAPLIGRLTDRIGYRNIMIYDTVVLFFVCCVYGYADRIFDHSAACWAVCVNFVLDAVISTTSMATSIYVRDISDNNEEVTSSLTTGISINHLISILAALAGGWVWNRYGFGVLFIFASVMALANTAFAMTIPSSRAERAGR